MGGRAAGQLIGVGILVLVLAGCGAQAPTVEPPVTPVLDQPAAGDLQGGAQDPGVSVSTQGCTLAPTEDLILWQVVPGMPATAQIVGNIDTAACKPYADTLRQVTPSKPGFCSAVARLRDNPGYVVNTFPAQKPAKVIAQYGAAC